MRAYGALFNDIPQSPDTVQRLLMTGGSSAQAMDWPSSAAAVFANATSAGAHLVRVTAITTAGAQMSAFFDPVSTFAAVPTSGSSVTTGTTVGSTGNSLPLFGSRLFSVPTWSTGWSVAFLTSGYAIVEVWKK